MKKSRTSLIIWILWTVLMLLTFAMMKRIVPDAASKVAAYAAGQVNFEILDVKVFGFGKAETLQVLEALGEPGRKQYQRFHNREDLVYPFTYGLFFLITLYLAVRKKYGKRTPLMFTLLVPTLAMLSDLAENHSIGLLIEQFPALKSSTVMLASWSNAVKWTMVFLSFVLIAVFSIIALWHRVSKKEH